MSATDIKFSSEIFRKDHPMVLAKNRHLASIASVRLAYDAAGYEAGRVIARNSVTGLFQKYDNGGASGLDSAVAVLFEEVKSTEFASTGDSLIARGIMRGEVFEAKLTGLDANAKTDLNGRSYTDADGVVVFSF
jgi:hypothetical protein